MRELTTPQWDALIEQYVQLQVDSMDYKSLEQFVYDTMEDFCNNLSNKELIKEIEYTLSEEDLQEFITTIKEDSQG